MNCQNDICEYYHFYMARRLSLILNNLTMTSKRQLLLVSSSVVHGHGYLEYAKDDILSFLKKNKVSKLLFIPYALRDYDSYAKKVKKAIEPWGINVESIHEHGQPKDQLKSAEAIFIGGGNTFKLLNTLYRNDLVDTIRQRVLNEGMPYMGSSAGTNVATVNICVTNDMPIEYPPSFEALNLVSFNINPHYLDPVPDNTHRGETREERITQYLEDNPEKVVLGLREGCHLLVEGDKVTLKGLVPSKIFKWNQVTSECLPESDLSFLLI